MKPNHASSSNRRTAENNSDEIDLSQWFATLLHHKKWIAAGLVGGCFVGMIYVLLATPVYQANALVQVESKNQNSILGDLGDVLSAGSPDLNTEIELIKSRMVLGRTVEALGLSVEVTPRYTPLIGRMMHRLSAGSAQPELKIRLFRAPHAGAVASVRMLGADEFTFWADGQPAVKGRVGTIVHTPQGYALLIASAQAKAGQEFELSAKSPLAAIRNISNNLAVSDSGKQSGIIRLRFDNTQPQLAQEILQSVIENYVRQNQEAQAQVAESGLKFIGEQLPKIKDSLDHAEDQLNAYRDKHATIDIGMEAKGVIDSLNLIEQQLTLLKTKEAEMAELFTPNHPTYAGLRSQQATLNKAKKDLLARISKMPQTQQDVIRLTRNVDIAQTVYLQLLNKQQELGIQKAGNIGNVRIVDHAVTAEEPIRPKKTLIVLATALAGGFLALFVIALRRMLHRGIEQAEDLERIGITVFAAIPLSEEQHKNDFIRARLRKAGKGARADFLLAAEQPADVAVEAIRALRTGIYFAMADARNHTLMVSGATPGVGKTFVSANLAVIMAQSGKRVLLIDADMRKGYVHEIFEIRSDQGLSAVLAGMAQASQTVRPTAVQGLDVMVRGTMPTNPAELLLTSRLQELLQWAESQYDYIIIDVPPILAVTDAAIIGQYVGNVFLVARFAVSTVSEIEAAIGRFENSSITVKGVVLNGIQRSAGNYHAYDSYSVQYKNE